MKQPINKDSNSKYFRLKVMEDSLLFDFLKTKLSQQSISSIKLLLKNKNILLNNNQIITKFDYLLKSGDEIRIISDKSNKNQAFSHPKLKIIFEDDSIIVIHKREGLLSVGTLKHEEETAYNILNKYIKLTNKQNRIYLLHRLDRDTSGIMMFAKNQSIQSLLQSNWNEYIVERTYIAIVYGTPVISHDTITTYLTEDKSTKMHSHQNEVGQKAITSYKTLKTNGKYSLLSLELQTGRKNQIRIHLQSIGNPIVGDQKYGNQKDKQERLFLHAQILAFKHPITNEINRFETPIPKSFLEWLEK